MAFRTPVTNQFRFAGWSSGHVGRAWPWTLREFSMFVNQKRRFHQQFIHRALHKDIYGYIYIHGLIRAMFACNSLDFANHPTLPQPNLWIEKGCPVRRKWSYSNLHFDYTNRDLYTIKSPFISHSYTGLQYIYIELSICKGAVTMRRCSSSAHMFGLVYFLSW